MKITILNKFFSYILSAAMTMQQLIFGTTFTTKAISALRLIILVISAGLVLIAAYFKLNLVSLIIIGILPNAYTLLFYTRSTPDMMQLDYERFKHTGKLTKIFYLSLVTFLVIIFPLILFVFFLLNK